MNHPNTITFNKYHGTGNDFVIIDNRANAISFSAELIHKICDRHFGIGADGLILLEASKKADFMMTYFNADGYKSSMCGNGGRCIAAFASRMGIVGKSMLFEAIDGLHHAEIITQDANVNIVRLEMSDVTDWQFFGNDLLVDTGSPHYIIVADDLEAVDVEQAGRKVRNDQSISTEGVNVDFLTITTDHIKLRTYERGVEGETLSCGTGVTAAAIATALKYGGFQFSIQTKGGELQVSFQKDDQKFHNIFLTGPATFVFEGEFFVGA
jgi:diaminopimelate epimerase